MTNTDNLPKLYKELTDWWPILFAPEDYAEEVETYGKEILAHSHIFVNNNA